jgi:hypothetical protein
MGVYSLIPPTLQEIRKLCRKLGLSARFTGETQIKLDLNRRVVVGKSAENIHPSSSAWFRETIRGVVGEYHDMERMIEQMLAEALQCRKGRIRSSRASQLSRLITLLLT